MGVTEKSGGIVREAVTQIRELKSSACSRLRLGLTHDETKQGIGEITL